MACTPLKQPDVHDRSLDRVPAVGVVVGADRPRGDLVADAVEGGLVRAGSRSATCPPAAPSRSRAARAGPIRGRDRSDCRTASRSGRSAAPAPAPATARRRSHCRRSPTTTFRCRWRTRCCPHRRPRARRPPSTRRPGLRPAWCRRTRDCRPLRAPRRSSRGTGGSPRNCPRTRTRRCRCRGSARCAAGGWRAGCPNRRGDRRAPGSGPRRRCTCPAPPGSGPAPR